MVNIWPLFLIRYCVQIGVLIFQLCHVPGWGTTYSAYWFKIYGFILMHWCKGILYFGQFLHSVSIAAKSPCALSHFSLPLWCWQTWDIFLSSENRDGQLFYENKSRNQAFKLQFNIPISRIFQLLMKLYEDWKFRDYYYYYYY